MAEVTQPGYFHTAGSAHLEGIDFGGKTGTAQVMSHEALDKTDKGKITRPNVWFVGVTPRRNPELVVAVLWQNGEFSYYPARIGAAVVSAYVEKQRRLAHNLVPRKPMRRSEMGAVWTSARSGSGQSARSPASRLLLQAGNFLVKDGQIVAHASSHPRQPPSPSRMEMTLELAQLSRGGHLSAPEGTIATMRRFLSFRDFDWALLGMVLLLCTISVFEIYSATLHTKYVGFHTKQIFWIVGGLVAMFLFAKIDYHKLIDFVPWA